MYQRILLAYDGSREGRAALVEGARMAKQNNAQIYLLACMRIPEAAKIDAVLPDGLTKNAVEEVQSVLNDGVALLKEQGIQATGYLRHGDPAREICQFAVEQAVELIVLGHKNQTTLARWWRGSVEFSILEHTPCSVLIALDRSPE